MGKRFVIITTQAFSIINFRGPLIRQLVEAGAQVFAIAPDYDEALMQKVSALGAKPVCVKGDRNAVSLVADMQFLGRLVGELKRIRPDAVLCYFIKAVIYGGIACRLLKIRKFYALIEGLGYVFGNNQGMKAGLIKWIVVRLYRCALKRCARVYFLNREDKALFTGFGIVRSSQCDLINGIGVDLTHYPCRAPVTDKVTFVLVARMLVEKGVQDYVEAARLVREKTSGAVDFVLVGGTDTNPGSISEAKLKAWDESGVVRWLGSVSDVRPILESASVFVLPSYYREGLPRSNMEAMAMGRPLITTDWVGCKETVVDQHNGFLVPVKSPEAIANAMLKFLEAPDLIVSMGRHSRAEAEKRFDVRKVNAKLINDFGLQA